MLASGVQTSRRVDGLDDAMLSGDNATLELLEMLSTASTLSAIGMLCVDIGFVS